MIIGVEATSLQGNKSGVGHYTHNLLGAVMRGAPEHNYVLFFNRDVRSGWQRLGNERIHDRHFMPVRNAWMQLLLPAALREEQPDLCHFINYLAPLTCPVPYIVTIYDMTLFLTPRMHQVKKRLLDKSLIPPVARRAAAIITLSESARADIVRCLRVPPSKVRVIAAAAAPEFRPVTDAAQLAAVRARYCPNAPYVLHVGTREPRKNLVRLITAFARVKSEGLPHKLLLVGQPGWGGDQVQATITRFGLENEVLLAGYVPQIDLPALYTMAELLAFPSLYEGFGLPVVEAMACGAPVLTSRTSSLREVAAMAALLVDPLSVDEMARAMRLLLTDAELRAELRERGLRRAAEFTWEGAARGTLALYEEVAHAAARQRSLVNIAAG